LPELINLFHFHAMVFYISIMRKFVIIFFLFVSQMWSQKFELNFQKKLFDNAVCFSINQIGSIYVVDGFRNEIYLADSSFEIKESYGGSGSDELSFDSPVDIFATSLTVFVTDRNNNRIQVFDRKLNFIYTFDPKSSNHIFDEILYPAGCVISTAGDYFILDNENNRVLKFDSNGKFILQFGNYESGAYQLTNPKKMLTDGFNYIFILELNRLIIFDLFGNGVIQIPIDIDIISASLSENYLILNSEYEILIFSINDFRHPVGIFNLEKDFSINDIRQAAIVKNKLIVLTKERLIKFNLSN